MSAEGDRQPVPRLLKNFEELVTHVPVAARETGDLSPELVGVLDPIEESMTTSASSVRSTLERQFEGTSSEGQEVMNAFASQSGLGDFIAKIRSKIIDLLKEATDEAFETLDNVVESIKDMIRKLFNIKRGSTVDKILTWIDRLVKFVKKLFGYEPEMERPIPE